jgi:ribonuclease HII
MALKPYLNIDLTEAGCDEAGRGCLSGPVFASAVILPKDFYHPLLNDSKQIPERTRYELRTIIEKEALAWAVAYVSNEHIDEINILNASFLAMHKAIDALKINPEYLLIDGNRFKPYTGISHKCIIKGDAKFAAIAAASVLAKTYRDDFMNTLHIDYPCYGWNQNKGYGTAFHRAAIEKHGISIHHRRSFKLVAWDLFHQQ